MKWEPIQRPTATHVVFMLSTDDGIPLSLSSLPSSSSSSSSGSSSSTATKSASVGFVLDGKIRALLESISLSECCATFESEVLFNINANTKHLYFMLSECDMYPTLN